MTLEAQTQTNDSATGPIAGTLFQFEKALLLLASLEDIDQFISVEQVDDVATHRVDGSVIATFQSKHSIVASSAIFSDTSKSLWRTLEIWINKLKNGVFTADTTFTFATNKKIPEDFFVRYIANNSFENVLERLNELLAQQEAKLEKMRLKNPNAGASMIPIMDIMKLCIENKTMLEKIKNKIVIHDEQEVKTAFLNKIHAFAELITDLQRDRFYEEFYGWITLGCKARWNNSSDAQFSKRSFDDKLFQIRSNPSIVNAIFRTKKLIGTVSDVEINKKKTELFVKQIEDIERRNEAKQMIIKNAILDMIYYDIEIKHVAEKGDYTQPDFDEFLEQCKAHWQQIFNSIIIHETDHYDDEKKNELAIEIFDSVMSKIQIEFKEGFCFTTSNEYVRNGSFLQLSNIPEIGWHPEWQTKYKQ